MVMSIERLYSRQCPKSITGDPSMFRKSANPMTGEDVLGILGQVQHREPLGAAVLDAQIAQDKNARAKCVGTLQAYLASNGLSDNLAFALAEVATAEVCDSPACKKCQGTGSVLSKEHSKFVECPRCNGVGRYIPSQRELHQMVCHLLPAEQAVTRYEFNKKWYDVYMGCVEVLHRAAGQAGQCAKGILEACG